MLWRLFCMTLIASSINARSILMEPRPAQVSFADKVAVYVHAVHARIPEGGVGYVLVKAALLTSDSAMKHVIAILNELGPYLINDQNVAKQEACSAALIKLLVPVVSQFETALFQGIRMIEQRLAYWRYQALHSVSYFFHKSPLKYFTFDQRKEIEEKIQQLKKVREQHFELLGRINIQLSSFDAQSTVDAQYAWIQKLCRILFTYDEKVQVAEDAEIFPLLYEATHLVSHYETYREQRLEKYEIPSLLARCWIEIGAVAAAIVAAENYRRTHDSKIQKFKQDANEVWVSTKNIVFGKDDGKSDVLDRYEAQLQKFNDKKIPISASKKTDVVREMNSRYLDDFVEGIGCIILELKDATAQVGNEKPGTVERGLTYLFGLDRVRNASKKVANRLAKSEEEPDSTADDASYAVHSSSDMSTKNPSFTIEESFQGWYDTLRLFIDLQIDGNPRIWSLVRSAPFTIPAMWGSWKLGKILYKKYRTVPDCEPIRIALVDIALILNVYGDARPAEMDATDFGRLTYLAYMLELDIHLIPKQYRESFLLELGLLHTSSLNAKQKMKVIDLMYKKYPFLAFQGMTIA